MSNFRNGRYLYKNLPEQKAYEGFLAGAKTLSGRKVVRPVRFELTTFCSGGKRSIQAELRAR